jgi:hypothetical protein
VCEEEVQGGASHGTHARAESTQVWQHASCVCVSEREREEEEVQGAPATAHTRERRAHESRSTLPT